MVVRKCELLRISDDKSRAIFIDLLNKEEILRYLLQSEKHKNKFWYIAELILKNIRMPDVYDKEDINDKCRNVTAMKKKSATDQLDKLFSATPVEENRLDALVLAARFLEQIQAALDEKGMTRKSLAEAMGTSASWLTQMFRGDKLPNLENLALMAKILDIEFEIKILPKSERGKVSINAKREAMKKSAHRGQAATSI